MIILLPFLLIVIFFSEFLILKKGKNIENNLLLVKNLNVKLDILKELSYLLVSIKDKTLNEILEKFSISFLKQNVFTDFSVILKENDNFKVFRFENHSFSEDNKLTSLEEQRITAVDSQFVYTISLKGAKVGHIVFFSKENKVVDQDSSNFLCSLASAVNLFLKRLEFNKLLSKEEQIKLINTEW